MRTMFYQDVVRREMRGILRDIRNSSAYPCETHQLNSQIERRSGIGKGLFSAEDSENSHPRRFDECCCREWSSAFEEDGHTAVTYRA